VVQGHIRDMYYQSPHLQPTALMKKRVHANLKDMERDGYFIHTFPLQGSLDQVVAFLKEQDKEMQSLDVEMMAGSYLLYETMVQRVRWAAKVVAARMALPKPRLGEVKVKRILQEFPTSFQDDYDVYGDEAVERLSTLRTSGNMPLMSLERAKLYCEQLFRATKKKRTRRAATAAATPTASNKPKKALRAAAAAAVTPPCKKARGAASQKSVDDPAGGTPTRSLFPQTCSAKKQANHTVLLL